MEEKKMLAEMNKNCEEKMNLLVALLAAYDLTQLGYKVQDEHCKEVHNRVLRENEFFCTRDLGRGTEIKVGDRITDESYLFLLSDTDFSKVMELSHPILVAEKITDERGYFLVDWAGKRCAARNELINFLLDEIVPSNLKPELEVCRNNVLRGDKLIDIFRNSLKDAA